MQCRRLQFESWVGKSPWRRDRLPTPVYLVFPCGSARKESACNLGDLGSITGLGRSPGKGKGYLLLCCGLENSMHSPWDHRESDTTERLSLSNLLLRPPSFVVSNSCSSRTKSVHLAYSQMDLGYIPPSLEVLCGWEVMFKHF